MAIGSMARRHAQAIFQIALETGELDRWRSDLHVIAETLRQPDLLAVLGNAKIRFGDKANLVHRVMPDIGELALNLTLLLISKGRLHIVEGMVAGYDRLLDTHRGMEHAEVTTVVSIDDDEMDRIARWLQSLTGKKVEIDTRLDPDIMGGLVVRIGDTLIDGSTKSQLAALRKSLIGTAR